MSGQMKSERIPIVSRIPLFCMKKKMKFNYCQQKAIVLFVNEKNCLYNCFAMKEKILLADIGNTSIDFAFYENENLFGIRKIKIQEKDEILGFLSENLHDISRCLISSVNRKGLSLLLDAIKKEEIPYRVIDSILMDEYCKKYGYTIKNTAYLGSDLFLDVIAREEAPQIIIDLGTVGKILYLDEKKVFHGASIFPDIQMFMKMMNQGTEQLNETILKENPPLVSLKTDECMSSGTIYGMASLVSGMAKRILEEYHLEKCTILLTGGYAPFIKEVLKEFHMPDFEYIEDLCLEGMIRLIKR